ncbi:MAG: hypothetical protein H0Z24_03000 [Thermosipho sp. (in: Bacteria)]|nr:hypothetical protein [Thermosipho sp. (in: thermotogales)]
MSGKLIAAKVFVAGRKLGKKVRLVDLVDRGISESIIKWYEDKGLVLSCNIDGQRCVWATCEGYRYFQQVLNDEIGLSA